MILMCDLLFQHTCRFAQLNRTDFIVAVNLGSLTQAVLMLHARNYHGNRYYKHYVVRVVAPSCH